MVTQKCSVLLLIEVDAMFIFSKFLLLMKYKILRLQNITNSGGGKERTAASTARHWFHVFVVSQQSDPRPTRAALQATDW